MGRFPFVRWILFRWLSWPIFSRSTGLNSDATLRNRLRPTSGNPDGLHAPPDVVEGMRLISLPDLASMKLNAIAGRGSRKDFIDLFFLLQTFSLDEMLAFYQAKYSDGNPFLIRKSLSYFDDAEREAMPVMLAPVAWPEIKKAILRSSGERG
jgi:hypothetical protein